MSETQGRGQGRDTASPEPGSSESPLTGTAPRPGDTGARSPPMGEDLHLQVARHEQEITNLTQTVNQLSDTVDKGFARTQQMFRESEERAAQRSDELHNRVTELSERTLRAHQPNWGVVVTAALAFLTLLGGAGAFVNMRLSPLEYRYERLHEKVEDSIRPRLRGHTSELSRLEQANKSLRERLDRKRRRRMVESIEALERFAKRYEDRLDGEKSEP